MGIVKLILGVLIIGNFISTNAIAGARSELPIFSEEQKQNFISELANNETTEESVSLDLQEVLKAKGLSSLASYQCRDSLNPKLAICEMTILRNNYFDNLYEEKFVYKIEFYVLKSPYKPRALKVTNYEALFLETKGN
jgi:hypothetical protein